MLCFGGSKNGMAVGEAVIYFDHKLSEEFAARCKQAGQLASKMRFLARPVGRHDRGRRLAHATPPTPTPWPSGSPPPSPAIPGRRRRSTPPRPTASSSTCPTASADATARPRAGCSTAFIGGGGRLMCSWDTRPEDVDALLADLADVTAEV